MSKNKGFSETSAGRYSLALYELATEANNLSEIEIHSGSIINLIASSEDFKSLIKDPTNSKEDQLNALSKISEQYKINELLTKFLNFLISKRRFRVRLLIRGRKSLKVQNSLSKVIEKFKFSAGMKLTVDVGRATAWRRADLANRSSS